MRVLLLTRYDRLGASSRVRAYQYLPYLKSAGIDVVAAPLLPDSYLEALYAGRSPDAMKVLRWFGERARRLRRGRGFDLWWVEYELFPWLPFWLERAAIRSRVPYVVELDDAVFHRYDQHPRLLVRRLLGRKIDAVMREAAMVIAGNDYIARRAREAGSRRVEVLPSVVDLDRYSPAAEPAGPFTVGWIGSPTASVSLQEIVPAMRALQRSGSARLRLVGSGAVELPGVEATVVPWTENGEAAEIAGFHVGVMPLRDDLWSLGKCGYKLIQYMAAARPVVASPVGVNTEIVEHGLNGFLARSPAEWISALEKLRADPELRRRMGEAGRRRVEERYALRVTAPRLADLLREAARSGADRQVETGSV